MEDLPIPWILWAITAYIAMRCLISLVVKLRDRLEGLLVAYVERKRIEQNKKIRIRELRERIRKKKAREAAELEKQREKLNGKAA